MSIITLSKMVFGKILLCKLQAKSIVCLFRRASLGIEEPDGDRAKELD
jgi:hypothetical protein